MAWSREDFPSTDDETDSAADSDIASVFDVSDDDETNVTDISDIDDDEDDDASLFDDEVRHPPEYYLNGAANLDVQRLRQQRFGKKTRARLVVVKEYCIQYCTFVNKDPIKCFQEVDAKFLYGFLSWVCDQRRGKEGRRTPGIGHTSSLETFWKQYLQVYTQETGGKIDEIIQRQGQDVVQIVAIDKELDNTKRESATMYVEDLAEYARVVLATTHMTFEIGWLRIQHLLFCQLAGITGNRPEALVELRFRHLQLTLVRDRDSDRPRLFIWLTAEFTKTYLGTKDANTFPIPEIIYDPTLVLSPHVFLLGMLFKARAFKSPSIDSPERLYSLDVLDNLNEQQLPLKEEFDEKFIFCQAVREAEGFRIAHERQLPSGSVRYRMKKGGQITGFAEVTKPYCLRDSAAKALNESPDVSDSMQNLILQHSSIDTYLKHYLDRRINVDLLGIHRGRKTEKVLMRFACSMSRSIDPRRPWKLTPSQSASVKYLPCIVKLAQHIDSLSGAPVGSSREKKFQKARRRLRNEMQRQRRLLLVEIVNRFKKEQPVIDSERQLSGKIVDEDARGALERSDRMTPEQLLLIDAILTLPETSPEKELQRRIVAIHAVTVYCGVEEGKSHLHVRRGRPVGGGAFTIVKAQEQKRSELDIELSQAILSVMSDKRPTKCFLCLGNPRVSICQRIHDYGTPGSLSRHFHNIHVKRMPVRMPPQPQIDCSVCHCGVCDIQILHRTHLLNHAERFHGTVSRRTA
ncbi:hypothetical protein N431DRAFT_407568 [Stipitochalara longipes BDJ]|nr:hypothetical protein N431DRAFT_407568 [Stipitochalara longipes BDJ]